MSQWPETIVAWLILCAVLVSIAGCSGQATPTVTIGVACNVPTVLDYDATGPVPFASVDTPLQKHLQDEAKERGAHTKLAGDYNALREHVKGCH